MRRSRTARTCRGTTRGNSRRQRRGTRRTRPQCAACSSGSWPATPGCDSNAHGHDARAISRRKLTRPIHTHNHCHKLAGYCGT
eukprot:1666566-Prymnesium_polylepis.1